ncbi:OpgC domain-containing protein [candidate division WWE3 bacterium]|nr:OpgC domain-containing protein [candidate division WWE3 bacterium]
MRNKILDVLRGHYLLAILIDHLNKTPSFFEYYNGMGNLWVSAAEGFVFISGLLLGVINFPKLEKYGFLFVFKRLVKRAFKLHVISVVLTVAYSLAGLKLGTWPVLGHGIVYTSLKEIFINAAFFKYSYGWADLLILYVILVAMSPFVIYFIYKGYWYIVLFISLMFWYQRWALPDVPRISGSYFPVMSWQFLFVAGLIIGRYKEVISRYLRSFPRRDIFFLIVCMVTLLTIYLSAGSVYYGWFDGSIKKFIDQIFAKTTLGPGRIALFFVWFAAFYYLTAMFLDYIVKYLGWLYLRFGQNSLLTYIIQSIVLFAWFYFPQGMLPSNFVVNNLTNLLVIGMVWLLVGFVLWYNRAVSSFWGHINVVKKEKKRSAEI